MKRLFLLSSLLIGAASANAQGMPATATVRVDVRETFADLEVQRCAPAVTLRENGSATSRLTVDGDAFEVSVSLTRDHDRLVATTTVRVFRDGKSDVSPRVRQWVGQRANVGVGAFKMAVTVQDDAAK